MTLFQVPPIVPNPPVYPPYYPPSPDGGSFWNPANWAPFVEKIGIPGFFAIVLFGFFVYFVWKALTQWDKHLIRQERLMGSQLVLCRQVHGPGGTANVSDFRDAGRDIAGVLQDMGDGISEETGASIKPKLERLLDRLHNSPPPLPSINDIQERAN